MRSTKITAVAAILCALLSVSVQAQSTFHQVYQILQSHCAQCHGGSNPIAYNLGTTPAETYAALVSVTPLNPAAAAKGHKYIDPGHPYNSFLLKKAGGNLDGWFALDTPYEGNPMPQSGTSLTAYEAELIRQWIMMGAKQSGYQVDTALIQNYYSNGGQPFEAAPAPPPSGQGIQLRLGPIFMPPVGQSGNEIEVLKKEQLKFASDQEVVRIDGDLNPQSHHFLLFMFDDSVAATQYPQGIRVVSLLNTATDGSKALQGAWQYDHSVQLPAQTAFYYDKRDVLDLNYHIKNYSSTDILPADLYVNVYTQPRGSGAREMHAQLVNNGGLFLLPGTNNVSMEDTWGGGDDREIWQISSHTHKYGTDFDIFVKDSTSGNRGPQIYEGFYDREYTFNQGFYDWQHPAIRIFDPLYTVHQSEGLIFDTKYNNTSGNFVTFGLTTNDEMQLSTYLYVNKHDVVASTAPATIADPYRFIVYPNPMKNQATIDFGGVRRSGHYVISDVNGKQLVTGDFGKCTQFSTGQQDFAAGVYMLQLTLDNGKVLSRKLVVN